MESIIEPLHLIFIRHFRERYNELINRNADKLKLYNEKALKKARIELLESEYYNLYSSFGKGRYAKELFRKLNVLIDKLSLDVDFAHKFAMAKSQISDFSSESNDKILEWLNQSDEILIKEIADYAAWVSIMGYGINDSDLFIVENTFNDEEISNDKNSRKKAYKFKWTGSDEQLIKLYEKLQIVKNSNDKSYYKSNYIDCPDFKLFERHFLGKKLKRKIIWIKPFYELVYFLDHLCYYMDNSAYNKSKNMILPEVVNEHFELKRDQGNINLSNHQSYADSRSRLLKSLESDPVMQKKNSKVRFYYSST